MPQGVDSEKMARQTFRVFGINNIKVPTRSYPSPGYNNAPVCEANKTLARRPSRLSSCKSAAISPAPYPCRRYASRTFKLETHESCLPARIERTHPTFSPSTLAP